MEETTVTKETFYKIPTTGRKEIISSYKEVNENNIYNVINESIKLHNINALEIQNLLDIYKGIQDIIKREKTIRPEINNKEVINYAMMITRVITGYFMGEPLKYTSLNPKIEIDSFNDSLRNSGNNKANSEIAQFQSICGLGYKYQQYINGQIKYISLNPLNTFVVKDDSVFKNPIAGITYTVNYDNYGNQLNYTYLVYVNGGYYKVTTNKGQVLTGDEIVEYYETSYSIPLVEYPNNMFRIGDFEPVIGILNLLNKTMNDRMNAIEQFVQNLLIFINCELKDESEYDKIRQKGFLTLKNKLPNGGNSDIKMITETLNQDQIQSYVDSLKSMLFEIVGIPDRKTTGGGSGDTGSAVELRDGWQDLEMVARNKQLQYEFSERKSLGVTLEILHSIEKENVTIEERDVEIKFSRNKNTNLLVKTQGLMNLMETKILTPSEALKVVDIINDIEEEVKKAQEFWEDEFANKTVENNNENLIIEDNIDQLTNKGGEEDAFARNNKQDK